MNKNDISTKQWSSFNILFGIAFGLKLFFSYAFSFVIQAIIELPNSPLHLEDINVDVLNSVSVIVQVFSALLMVGTLGYFGWKFSGNWKKCFVGLLGFLWIFLIGPILGYIIVERFHSLIIKRS